MLAVPDSMAALFPGGGILKGSLLSIAPITDSCSVALALAGEVTKHRGWVAVSGLPSLGLAAAAEMGVDLERLVLVPAPGAKWLEVTAALADGFDMILARPAARVAPADARRLAARVRQRGAVVVLVDPPGWPETPDLVLKILQSRWEGLEEGYGCLGGRKIDIELSGRRAKGQSRRRRLWLPAPPTRFGPQTPLDGATQGMPLGGAFAGMPLGGAVAGMPGDVAGEMLEDAVAEILVRRSTLGVNRAC